MTRHGAAVEALSGGVRAGGLACAAAGRQIEGRWLAGDIYLGLPRRGLWRVSAAPRSVVRQTLPRHRSAPRSTPRHPSSRATMHGATQAFRRAMAIGAAKSVSFAGKKTQTVLDLKLV